MAPNALISKSPLKSHSPFSHGVKVAFVVVPQRPGPWVGAGGDRVSAVRNYVADHNDGLEAADFDEYYDYPAETDTDLAGRFYVKTRARSGARSSAGEAAERYILEVIRWIYSHRAELCGREELSPTPSPGDASLGRLSLGGS